MDQDNLLEIENKLKESVNSLEKDLKESHINIESIFWENRNKIITNLKSYLTNISIISATIIPFSALVFQIPKDMLIINVNIWILSLFSFVLSLFFFIFCFLRLVEVERKTYVKLLLGNIGSGQIDFISFSQKEINDKIKELISILDTQNKFFNDLKIHFEEKDFVYLIKYTRWGSYIFLTGLLLFFTSIVCNKIINLFFC